MLLYGSWALRQRETSLVADAARETQAYATALGVAVETALRGPQLGSVQEIIDQVSRQPTVFGVLVYDTAGSVRYRSSPLSEEVALPDEVIERVLATGLPVAFQRSIGEEPVYSVARPLTDSADHIIGALEVAQPLTFLEADTARVRQRYFLNTLTLVAAMVVLVAWIVRRFVSAPLEKFSSAVRALGRGELGHRLEVGVAGAELVAAAEELNRMAGHLQEAQAGLLRQAEERVALERRLRQSERLAAMGELAAGVAHEIAAPLQVIRGRAELLLEQRVDSVAGTRNLEIIREQIGRITLIVRNLMNFARRREPRRLRVDLVELLRGVAEFLDAELARADVALALDSPPGAHVRGDPDLLHQVFLNLLINALHALESSEVEARRIHVRVSGSGGGEGRPEVFEVEIRDNGPGIPRELRERVFDPFFTTKEGARGTGLGLSVARAIVEDHGGRVTIEDAVPHGAVLRVVLPSDAHPAAAEASVEAAHA
jgi:signal transduction histidine kinase